MMGVICELYEMELVNNGNTFGMLLAEATISGRQKKTPFMEKLGTQREAGYATVDTQRERMA